MVDQQQIIEILKMPYGYDAVKFNQVYQNTVQLADIQKAIDGRNVVVVSRPAQTRQAVINFQRAKM